MSLSSDTHTHAHLSTIRITQPFSRAQTLERSLELGVRRLGFLVCASIWTRYVTFCKFLPVSAAVGGMRCSPRSLWLPCASSGPNSRDQL